MFINANLTWTYPRLYSGSSTKQTCTVRKNKSPLQPGRCAHVTHARRHTQHHLQRHLETADNNKLLEWFAQLDADVVEDSAERLPARTDERLKTDAPDTAYTHQLYVAASETWYTHPDTTERHTREAHTPAHSQGNSQHHRGNPVTPELRQSKHL